jgi:hypothetical protein
MRRYGPGTDGVVPYLFKSLVCRLFLHLVAKRWDLKDSINATVLKPNS